MVGLGSWDSDIVAALRAEFFHTRVPRDEGDLACEVGAIVVHLEGREPHVDLPLDVRAAAFQWGVWGSLWTTPRARLEAYGALARAIGRPRLCDEPPIRDRSVLPRRRRRRESDGISLGR